MKVLVDTSVWSLALRRNSGVDKIKEVNELSALISEFRVAIIGPIRQELLSGISDEENYLLLKEKLIAFEDILIETKHYELAAELFNTCRKKGIQGSHIDFLICAVSIVNGYSIFTTDKDFDRYRKFTGIRLHKIRED